MKPKKKGLRARVQDFARPLLGPNLDDLAQTDVGRGVVEYGKQFAADPAGSIAGLVDPVAGYRSAGQDMSAFLQDPSARTGLEALGSVMAAGQTGAVVPRPTVKGAVRNAFPGVYGRPDVIARASAEISKKSPESPLLKQLFGVTRDDLYQMSQRKGNVPGTLPGQAKKPKGSAAAAKIMTPQNERRILDTLAETKVAAPDVWKGMHAWYTMDPEFHRMVELMGPEKAAEMYKRLNTFSGTESPNMPVLQEFDRATAANWLAEQGRFADWKKFGGLPAKTKARRAPKDMAGIGGRKGHATTVKAQQRFMDTGNHGMMSPKVPPYIQASSVPELGFQTDMPVGDAHWARAVGLADTRTSKSFGESVSTPEMTQLAPWFRDRIAGSAGLEAVPAQAILWGAFSPQTGVKTGIGPPKLELHALEIAKAAKRLGVSPETARDLILMGKTYAGK